MSACFAFGLAAASPIGEASFAAGTPRILTGLPALPVVLAGGWLTNAVWCCALFRKNGTLYEYIGSRIGSNDGMEMANLASGTRGLEDKNERLFDNAAGSESDAMAPVATSTSEESGAIPLLNNYCWCLVAGTTWYFQFFFCKPCLNSRY